MSELYPRVAAGSVKREQRQIDDAVGIMTARWGQIRQIVVEVLAALRAVMLRIGDDDVPRTPQVEIA